MKKFILFILILSASTAHGQKLKDLLFSGKLKGDPTGVIRSTDDLSTKIDTVQKKAVKDTTIAIVQEKQAQPIIAATKDSSLQKAPVVAAITEENATTNDAEEPKTAAPAAPAKSLPKIWKEHIDLLIADMKNEVLTNKKIKKNTYSFSVEYQIDTEGVTTINKVTVTPENDLLGNYVKDKLTDNPPPLGVVLNSANQPQEVKRRYNFHVTKD